MADINILQNGELNTQFEPYRNDESKKIPLGWAPWWIPPSQKNGAPSWQNHIPVFESHFVSGDLTTRISTPFATHTAGLLQQVPAVEGEQYELSIEAQAWSSESEELGVIHDASDVNLQVGIDPTGGTDAQSPIIIWSKIAQPVGKWQTMRIVATAQTSILTVFIRSAPHLPKRQQSTFWRNAFLRPVGRYKRSVNIVGPGDTHIQLEPERPQPVAPIKIIASSQRNHRYVDLLVTRPNGEAAVVVFQDTRQEDDRYIWEYEFIVEDEGLHDIRFVGDRGARLFAQRLVKAAREVQIVPSGKPRLDYRRVYVLLPPTADEEWFVAAAKGSFVGRYTVGFSADDGGVGEVGDRVVISVNPHHWPETLTATWYQHNYPGTRFIAVVANKPADLEAWLSEWIDE